ncbi:hypothetical protein B0H14DRAFT_3664351 [Mycena olivaceomarginata]|nr:hypothetical protein B0H14DRAFT_3664351 [Mycena olivaceomarginata]
MSAKVVEADGGIHSLAMSVALAAIWYADYIPLAPYFPPFTLPRSLPSRVPRRDHHGVPIPCAPASYYAPTHDVTAVRPPQDKDVEMADHETGGPRDGRPQTTRQGRGQMATQIHSLLADLGEDVLARVDAGAFWLAGAKADASGGVLPSHEWVDRVTAHVLCRARERASGKIKTIAAAKPLGNNNTSDSDGSRFHSPVQLSQIPHPLAHSQSHPHLRSFDPAPAVLATPDSVYVCTSVRPRACAAARACARPTARPTLALSNLASLRCRCHPSANALRCRHARGAALPIRAGAGFVSHGHDMALQAIYGARGRLGRAHGAGSPSTLLAAAYLPRSPSSLSGRLHACLFGSLTSPSCFYQVCGATCSELRCLSGLLPTPTPIDSTPARWLDAHARGPGVNGTSPPRKRRSRLALATVHPPTVHPLRPRPWTHWLDPHAVTLEQRVTLSLTPLQGTARAGRDRDAVILGFGALLISAPHPGAH